MKEDKILKFIILLSGIFLPTACNYQRQDQPRSTQPQSTQQYYYDSEVWVGPGWYYGIYFSNENSFRNWYYRHRGHRYHRYYHYHGGQQERRHYSGGRHHRRSRR